MSNNVSADMSKFQQMSAQEMGETKVMFGKTHIGRTFAEVWNEEKTWAKWFTKAYADSQKPEHQKFLMYVEKMVTEHEQIHQLPPPETVSQGIVQPRCKQMLKAKAASMAAQATPVAVPSEVDSTHGM